MSQRLHFWLYIQKKWSKILRRYLYTKFIVTLFTIAKILKQPKSPSVDKWISKMCICPTEYHSAWKRKRSLQRTAAMDDHEDGRPSETGQLRKAECSVPPLTESLRGVKQLWRQKFQWWSPELGEGILGSDCLTGRVSVLQDRKSYGDGWWWSLQDNVNTFNITELNTWNG